MYNPKKKNDMKKIDMIFGINMAIALLLSMYLSARYDDKCHDLIAIYLLWNSVIIAAYLHLKRGIEKRHEWTNN